MRTQNGEVYETGKGDNPKVCSVDDIATINLDLTVLDAHVDEPSNRELTRRPSASKLLRRYIRLGIMPSVVKRMADWYPYGPTSVPSGSVNSRLSMKESE